MERAQPHEPTSPREPVSSAPHESGNAGEPVSSAPDEPGNAAAQERHAIDPGSRKRARHGRRKPAPAWILSERNPEGTVYGIVTVGALLAAESGLRDSYADTIGSAAIAIVLYWFAHSYADVLGLRLTKQRRISRGELLETFVQDWSIVRGATIPLLALIVAWAVGVSQETAVTAAVWTAAASLVVFEVAAGARSRSKPGEIILEVLAGATMGLAILALRALLH